MLYLIDLWPAPPPKTWPSLGCTPPISLITVGRDTQFEAEIKGFGRQSRKRQPVECLVDGRRVEQKEVDIGPNGTASAKFAYRFDTPADHAGRSSCDGRRAGRRQPSLSRRAGPSGRSVYCASKGRPSGRAFCGAADYLAVALSPQSQKNGPALVQAETATETALLDRNLAGYDCLFPLQRRPIHGQRGPTHWMPISAAAEVSCSGSAIVFFPTATTVNSAGKGRAGGPVHLSARIRIPAAYGRPKTQTWPPSSQRILPAKIGPLVERPQLRLEPVGIPPSDRAGVSRSR